ncbi:gas vesicle protein [Streptomyces sp. NPDC006283]|uniref:gas vesicle protein n=1 Tax=Streptomyces sp. NPDC006283 TaxID=3156741 RepID=UPI0033ABAB66
MAGRTGPYTSRAAPQYAQGSSANLADILERVLDKGIVIAGDIQINLLDIELLTIKLRLLVASVDKAKEMGIDWWEHDPSLSSRAAPERSLAAENRRLREEIEALRRGGEVTGRGEERSVEELTESGEEAPAAPRRKRAAPRSKPAAPRARKRGGTESDDR